MAYSKAQAAQKLGVSEKTLDRQIVSGNLSYHKIGSRILFDEEDLESYWNSCRRPSLREMQERAAAAKQHLRKTVEVKNETTS
jgi:excisionase family DNA binding protein